MVAAVPAVVVAALMRRGAETARCSTIPDSDEEQGCNSEGHNVILPLKLQVRFTLPRRESKHEGMTSHGDAPSPPVFQPLGDDTRIRERGC